MMDILSSEHGWGMGGGMGFFAILVWGILIVAAIFLAKGLVTPSNNYPSPPPHETPLSILEKRFANGEIDAEKFKRMKELLKDNGAENE